MDFKKIIELVERSYSIEPSYKEIVAGVPEDYEKIKTLEDLLNIRYRHISVTNQLRRNFVRIFKDNQNPYNEIIGYEDDVIPSINRGILAGHDLLLVGQIGQAKTKIAESIAKNLLSPIPIINGTITNDIPSTISKEDLLSLLRDNEIQSNVPKFIISKDGEEIIRNNGLDTRITWIKGIDRFKYILATPDISVKDLVGQIDAIKIAKKGVEMYKIDSYSPGQLLQARHGILCIDELPVLDPRKQVSLLSILQEGKFTTSSYPIYFEPNLKIIATSNPIDYTHSGKIIEPLFDRFKSHIYTKYPKDTEEEMLIIVQEIDVINSHNVILPLFILKTISMISYLARKNRDINQDKGVSVRMSIHSTEIMISEAERTRSIKFDLCVVPRYCDIYSIHQTSKFELLEIEDNYENRINIVNKIIEKAIKIISTEYLEGIEINIIESIKKEFNENKEFWISQEYPGGKISKNNINNYVSQLKVYPNLGKLVEQIIIKINEDNNNFLEKIKKYKIQLNGLQFVGQSTNPEYKASIIELVLEGLRHMDPPILQKKEGKYEIV
ncbi:MAG: AAA family ATPase [Nitrososphaeraceae archaeon]